MSDLDDVDLSNINNPKADIGSYICKEIPSENSLTPPSLQNSSLVSEAKVKILTLSNQT